MISPLSVLKTYTSPFRTTIDSSDGFRPSPGLLCSPPDACATSSPTELLSASPYIHTFPGHAEEHIRVIVIVPHLEASPTTIVQLALALVACLYTTTFTHSIKPPGILRTVRSSGQTRAYSNSELDQILPSKHLAYHRPACATRLFTNTPADTRLYRWHLAPPHVEQARVKHSRSKPSSILMRATTAMGNMRSALLVSGCDQLAGNRLG